MDHLTDRQFNRLVDIIESRVGIKLPPVKRIMVESRLRKRVRALGFPHLAAYGASVFEGSLDEDEMIHVIDCVTTNKTDFFREPVHFDLLSREIVPGILRQRGRRTPIKVWSSACSTGAEPYTIAMVLAEMARVDPFPFQVIGTDISTDVLAQARRAVYDAEMAADVPPQWRHYLMPSRDPDKHVVRIVPELRRTVLFARLNLMDATFPLDRDMDVIFCRNVLIYFDRETQQGVLTRLASHLRPGGFMLLGHSESMAGQSGMGLRQVVPSVYQSAASRASAA